MKDYRRYSFWLETCGDDLTPRPPLDSSIDVDIAILGGGFTGLWTAYYLLSKEPSLNVAIVEAEIAGFGASGRNGGWCFAGFPVSPVTLLQSHGYDAARLVSLEMYKAVDEVGRVTREEGIDAHYAKGGELEIARAAYDLPKLQKMYDEFRAIGLEDHYRLLDAEETTERINVARAAGSFHNREGAVIQPARLARGLARAVERRGGTIYEQTRVIDFTGAPNPSLVTAWGTVRAKTIVLAGEAYLSALPGMDRSIIPMTSHIVVTEPLNDELWEQIRWWDRDTLGGFGVNGGYIQHTADGRIAFGPYRGNYPFNSRISDDLDRDEKIFAHARKSTLDWFPMLQGVKFTHAWGGVFGIPRDRMPTMNYDPRTGIAAAYGYTGDGVATANLSGRVLTDLITETDSPLQMLPMTQGSQRRWEPEPLRWMGVTFVRKDRQRVLKKIEHKGKHPEKPSLSQRLYSY
ncbi:MAG TPA: FAD-dependent oxidoreductase [Thermomicrobiales bacterium]|nr:FAD-dependent oxidoreductase [Thermomicrobiales bacterium]